MNRKFKRTWFIYSACTYTNLADAFIQLNSQNAEVEFMKCFEQFLFCLVLHSLTQFFERARGMEFFKSIIQIPDLPDVRYLHPWIIEFHAVKETMLNRWICAYECCRSLQISCVRLRSLITWSPWSFRKRRSLTTMIRTRSWISLKETIRW